jgi:ubiquinone/menaquinone biosynthesis C-methylase UbiE
MNRIWNNKKLLNVLSDKYIKSQSKKGIRFHETKQFWLSKKSKLIYNKRLIENNSMKYPEYFTAPIHTYNNGHLNWNQAFQSSCHMEGSALMSVKDIKNDQSFTCSPEEAYSIYKTHIFDNIKAELEDINPNEIVDLGCGTGENTEMLALNYPNAFVTGLDLSPYYLSIGMYKYSDLNIQWIHANMEFTELAENSIDVVIICYAFHEMLPEAIQGTINEAHRILKKNGKIIIIDMDSEKLPKFPSFIDISEPHLKKYRNVRILDMLSNATFIKYQRKHLHQMSSLFVGTKS